MDPATLAFDTSSTPKGSEYLAQGERPHQGRFVMAIVPWAVNRAEYSQPIGLKNREVAKSRRAGILQMERGDESFDRTHVHRTTTLASRERQRPEQVLGGRRAHIGNASALDSLRSLTLPARQCGLGDWGRGWSRSGKTRRSARRSVGMGVQSAH